MLYRQNDGNPRRDLANLFLGIVLVLAAPGSASAQPGGYPRLANIYTLGYLDPAVIPTLAQWDLVVLNTVVTETQLAQLRSYNPNIRLFFYVAPYDVAYPDEPLDTWEHGNIMYAQSNDLWWYDRYGNPAVDWSATRMVNITALGAAGPSGNWSQYLEDRIVSLVT